MAQQFILLAGSVLAGCMKRQEEALGDIVRCAQGFGTLGEPQRYRRVHNAITQLVGDLKVLERTWRVTMPPRVLRPALGHAVHTAVVAVTHEVLQLRCIRPEEAQQLLDTLDPVLLCEQWFMDLSAPAPTQADRQLLAQESVRKFVPGFKRFKSLIDLLPSSLSNVVAQWKAGLLTHFNTDELKGLVVALFPDSPQRRASLKQLEQT